MAVQLHQAGEAHLNALISAGKYNTDRPWTFTAADGDALLGPKGDDWARYASVHLGDKANSDPQSRGHWEYPAAHADGDTEQVFRSGLIAAKQRSAQQGDTGVENAVDRLLKQIDDAEAKKHGVRQPGAKPAPAAGSPFAVLSAAALLRELPRLGARLVGTPLLVSKPKLDAAFGLLGPRIRVADLAVAAAKVAPLLIEALPKSKADQDGGEGADTPPDDAPYGVTADGIARICVDGSLVNKAGLLGRLFGLTPYSAIGAALNAALADPKVGGVLLEVDSFGGEASGCFDLCDAIYAARAAKPIYAAIDDNAMSAAYGVASSAQKVYISRTGGAGSVGVVAVHVDQSGQDAAEGLSYDYVIDGDQKADFSAHAPLSQRARATLQAEVSRTAQIFYATVARNRGMAVAAVQGLQAGLRFGADAVAAGLADAVGTPADAMADLRQAVAAKAAAAPPAAPAAPAPAPPPAPPAAAAAAPEGNVVSLDAVRDKSAADMAALAVETIELCRLAGRSDLATGFVAARAPLATVREKLTALRAEASAARPLSGHIAPDAGNNDSQQIAAGWDAAFAKASHRK